MKLSAIEARAKRNGLAELAGKSYRDSSSEIVASLNCEEEPVYLGIQDDDGTYTIIGRVHVFLSTRAGKKLAIPHSQFIGALQAAGMDRGKGGQFEYIALDEKNSVWVKDGATMSALWSIVLAGSRAQKGVSVR